MIKSTLYSKCHHGEQSTFNTDYKGGIGSEWNSGELVQILIDDEDMNLDARTKNQMKIKDNKTIVPAIKIGSPITLATLDTQSSLLG